MISFGFFSLIVGTASAGGTIVVFGNSLATGHAEKKEMHESSTKLISKFIRESRSSLSESLYIFEEMIDIADGIATKSGNGWFEDNFSLRSRLIMTFDEAKKFQELKTDFDRHLCKAKQRINHCASQCIEAKHPRALELQSAFDEFENALDRLMLGDRTNREVIDETKKFLSHSSGLLGSLSNR